ncbi:MAG: HEPN domain-containing protein [Treponema sp.]|nr:HEPN domain-containing protein [Treponema sp.]
MTLSDLLKQWFDIAADDLEVAKGCLIKFYPPKLAIACYHSQQATEKSLKGFLTLCDIEPPHIHNLTELCKMCMECDPSFSQILDLCDDLNPYCVVTRYPKEKEITEHMAKIAIDLAQEAYSFCLARVPELKGPK